MIILIILIILLFLTILFVNSKKNNEGFVDFNVNFLTKDESCSIILKNHKDYFSKMELKESKIRGCINSFSQHQNIVENCNKHYCNNTLSFTDKDKNNILICLNIITNIYNKYFHKLLPLPWNFIKVSKNIEGGMPHTIKDYIVLPENFLQYLNYSIENNNKSILIDNICLTLIHEQMHVFQKMDYSIFKELYQNYWNFDLCEIKLKKKYLKNQRINPDGYDNWCYKYNNTNIYPFVYLKNDYKYLNDVKTSAITIENDKINYKKIYDINDLNEYNNFFCNVSQNYHPNEISAILLSDLIISKINGKNINNCPALIKIIPWVKKYLQ